MVDPTAEGLIARLRRNPDDGGAFSALRAHYHRLGDFASLVNLLEGWAARARDPRAAAAAFHEAAELTLSTQGNRPRAVALYERALERNPVQMESSVRLQEIFEEAGDTRRLLDILERRAAALGAASADPRHVAAVHQQMGELWEQRFRRPDRAITHYRRAFELDPTLVPAIYAAREIYRNAGNLKAAATLYDLEANSETDPGRKVALFRELAHLRGERLADLEGAIVALKRALALAPGDLAVMHDLGMSLLRRADRAAEAAAATADRRRAADLLYQMAQRSAADHAIAYCEAALDAAPDHDGALELLEDLARSERRDDLVPLRWVGYLRAAPDAPRADELRRNLGRAYVEAGQIEDAIVCFEPLLESEDLEAAETLADLYRQVGREADVTRALSIAVASLPADRRVVRLREIVTLLAAEGKRVEAARRAREVLELDPQDTEALSFLIDFYRAEQSFVELRDLMVAAARVQGIHPELRQKRLREAAAISEQKLRDYDSAILAYRAVLTIDPSDTEAKKALRRLFEIVKRWDDLVQLLDREVLSATSPAEKAEIQRTLARIHKDERGDLMEAIDALRLLCELQPNDDEARGELCEALLAAGAFLEAVPLIRQRVQRAKGSDRVPLLRTLAHVLEEQIGDDDGAFEACTQLLDEEPQDIETLVRMERIDERAERHARLIETLVYHAELRPERERAAFFVRVARLADRELADPNRAAEYYARALDLDRENGEILDALCTVYDKSKRYKDLVVLLRERANLERDPRARAELYRRIARTLSERVRNPAAAAETWLEVLKSGDDEEALKALIDHARDANDHEGHSSYLGRLVAITKGNEQRRDLLLDRARVLEGKLDRKVEAAKLLREIVNKLDPTHVPSLTMLAALCEETGDKAGLAEVLERNLAATTDDGLRMPIAKRLADLYENDLADKVRAIKALTAWSDADLMDAEPQRRLIPLLEATKAWKDVLKALDALAGVEQDPDEVSAVVQRAAALCVERLADVNGAWNRLVARMKEGDAGCEQALLKLARDAGRGEQLAELYVQQAQSERDPEAQAKHWLHVANAFEEFLGDGSRALEAVLRAFALDLDDEGILAEVDRLSVKSGAFARLAQVYDTLLRRATSEGAKVDLLMRHARVLDEGAKDASGALDLVLRACGLAPQNDEVLARAEELAPKARRADELLVVYERRRNQADTDEKRMEAMLRAVRIADIELRSRERALGYLHQAVVLTIRDETLVEQVEIAARKLDEERPEVGPEAGRRALCNIYKRVAEDNAETPEVGGVLLSRAAMLFENELGDDRSAFEALKLAAGFMPADEALLDELEEFAEQRSLLPQLEAYLAQLTEEAIDSRTAAALMRRRGRILEMELEQFSEAAEVYGALLTLLPNDPEVSPRLRNCLRQAGRFEDLLILLDRELEKQEGYRRVALLKEIAAIWENDIKNRWEALDIWKKVLAIVPSDEAGQEALTRLGRSSVEEDPDSGSIPERSRAIRLLDDEEDEEEDYTESGGLRSRREITAESLELASDDLDEEIDEEREDASRPRSHADAPEFAMMTEISQHDDVRSLVSGEASDGDLLDRVRDPSASRSLESDEEDYDAESADDEPRTVRGEEADDEEDDDFDDELEDESDSSVNSLASLLEGSHEGELPTEQGESTSRAWDDATDDGKPDGADLGEEDAEQEPYESAWDEERESVEVEEDLLEEADSSEADELDSYDLEDGEPPLRRSPPPPPPSFGPRSMPPMPPPSFGPRSVPPMPPPSGGPRSVPPTPPPSISRPPGPNSVSGRAPPPPPPGPTSGSRQRTSSSPPPPPNAASRGTAAPPPPPPPRKR